MADTVELVETFTGQLLFDQVQKVKFSDLQQDIRPSPAILGMQVEIAAECNSPDILREEKMNLCNN